jgi:hypothetical protein
MKKTFALILVVVGVGFIGGGVYTTLRGLDAKAHVREELVAQRITTPEDASIPNAPVDDAATAHAMAQIINVHAAEATGGQTYATMGRFLAADGGDTSDEALALKDEEGNPVANPARNSWVTAVAITTALNTSYMAEQLSIFGLVVGVALLLTGVGLVILAFAVFGREPAAEAKRSKVSTQPATG